LACEHRGAVHAHAARAADHHAAALAVRERAVDLVLDDVESVEQRRPLGRVELVLAQRALPGGRVVTPDLEGDLHQCPFSEEKSATWAAGGSVQANGASQSENR